MALILKECICGRNFFTAKRAERVCTGCRRDRVHLAKERRVLRELSAPGGHSTEEWQQKIKDQDGRCFWCQRFMYDAKGRFRGGRDHLTPLSRNGSDSIHNIVAACWPCNKQKGRRTAGEYREYLADQISEVSAIPTLTGLLNLDRNTQLSFEPWPEAESGIARAVAQIAVSREMEESILPFHGFDVFAKKRAIHDRRQLLRAQVSELNRRKA